MSETTLEAPFCEGDLHAFKEANALLNQEIRMLSRAFEELLIEGHVRTLLDQRISKVEDYLIEIESLKSEITDLRGQKEHLVSVVEGYRKLIDFHRKSLSRWSTRIKKKTWRNLLDKFTT